MGVYSAWLDKYERAALTRTVAAPRRRRIWDVLARRVGLRREPAGVAVNGDQERMVDDQFWEFAAEGRPARTDRQTPARGRARVVHCIGTLNAGGAERQLCNLVLGSRAHGYEPQVMAVYPLEGSAGHYLHLIEPAEIATGHVATTYDPRFESQLRESPKLLALVRRLPDELRSPVVDYFGEFLVNPPDVVHAWLDHTNIWAGVAAVLAGVPEVVLSTRNVNPTHFPYLAASWFRPWYRWLASFSNVHFINNSHAGAEDYAAWLELPLERFHVILNGLDFGTVEHPGAERVDALRTELGLSSKDRLIAGVFRFSEEKQPEVFVQVLSQILRDDPRLHVAIAGAGPLEANIRSAITRGGAQDRFHLLGRRTDVASLLCAAELLLLTSRAEGTPNVLLEAQALKCPVVATRAGGATDAVWHEQTGLLCDVGDVDELVRSVRRLLDDEDARAAMASAGPAFIKDRFGLERMVEQSVAVYDMALGFQRV